MSTVFVHPYFFAISLTLLVVGIGLFLVWVVEASPIRPLLQGSAGVVAPYSNLLALLFGLFAAFLANDVSIHADRAHAAVRRVANSLAVVMTVADGLGERGGALKQLAIDYGKHTTDPNWRSPQQTAAAEAIGLKMMREVLFGSLASADSTVRQSATSSIMDMRTGRSEMVAIAQSRTGWLKWEAVFILGALTQMGVAINHFSKPRAALLAVTLFSFGMAFMLWVVLVRLDPFAGKNATSLAPIAKAYETATPH